MAIVNQKKSVVLLICFFLLFFTKIHQVQAEIIKDLTETEVQSNEPS